MKDEPAVAVISGAGSGIGRAAASVLARRGYRLALLGRTSGTLRETIDLAGAPGVVFPCDVRVAAEVTQVAGEIEASLGEVAVVVPCAGTVALASLEETPPELFAEIVDTNLGGTFHLLRAFLPGMRRRQARSWILPVLSVAATRGFPGWSAYCASKWGLRGLLAALREELRGSAVRLTAVFPGATATDLWDRLPGTWSREAMVPVEDVARAIGWALDVDAATALEEIHLGPAGGAL